MTDNQEVKTCAGCRFLGTRHSFYGFYYCHKTPKIDPISGQALLIQAGWNRTYEDRCGKDAKWFEPRPALLQKLKDFFK